MPLLYTTHKLFDRMLEKSLLQQKEPTVYDFEQAYCVPNATFGKYLHAVNIVNICM